MMQVRCAQPMRITKTARSYHVHHKNQPEVEKQSRQKEKPTPQLGYTYPPEIATTATVTNCI